MSRPTAFAGRPADRAREQRSRAGRRAASRRRRRRGPRWRRCGGRRGRGRRRCAACRSRACARARAMVIVLMSATMLIATISSPRTVIDVVIVGVGGDLLLARVVHDDACRPGCRARRARPRRAWSCGRSAPWSLRGRGDPVAVDRARASRAPTAACATGVKTTSPLSAWLPEMPITRNVAGPLPVLSADAVADAACRWSWRSWRPSTATARARSTSASVYQRPSVDAGVHQRPRGQAPGLGVAALDAGRRSAATAVPRARPRWTRSGAPASASSGLLATAWTQTSKWLSSNQPRVVVGHAGAEREQRRAASRRRARSAAPWRALRRLRRPTPRRPICALRGRKPHAPQQRVEAALAADRRAGRLQRLVERQPRGAPDRRAAPRAAGRRARPRGWRRGPGPRRRSRRRCRRTADAKKPDERVGEQDAERGAEHRAERAEQQRGAQVDAPDVAAAGADRLHRGDLARLLADQRRHRVRDAAPARTAAPAA